MSDENAKALADAALAWNADPLNPSRGNQDVDRLAGLVLRLVVRVKALEDAIETARSCVLGMAERQEHYAEPIYTQSDVDRMVFRHAGAMLRRAAALIAEGQ